MNSYAEKNNYGNIVIHLTYQDKTMTNAILRFFRINMYRTYKIFFESNSDVEQVS